MRIFVIAPKDVDGIIDETGGIPGTITNSWYHTAHNGLCPKMAVCVKTE